MKIKRLFVLSSPLIVSTALLVLLLLWCPSAAHGATITTTTVTTTTTLFFDQGTVYAPSLIVEFGPTGLPSKMRFTIEHTGSPFPPTFQDIYCVRPHLRMCMRVWDPSTIGLAVNVSGVINPVNLEWDAQSVVVQSGVGMSTGRTK